jgi:hypothetical protein
MLDFPRMVSSVTINAKRLETTKFKLANVLCFGCLFVVDDDDDALVALFSSGLLEVKKSNKGTESAKELKVFFLFCFLLIPGHFFHPFGCIFHEISFSLRNL